MSSNRGFPWYVVALAALAALPGLDPASAAAQGRVQTCAARNTATVGRQAPCVNPVEVRINPTDAERQTYDIDPGCGLNESDLRCRVTKATREGLAPVFQAEASKLRLLAADSQRLRVTVCPCGLANCLDAEWKVDRPPLRFDLVTIDLDEDSKSYLLRQGTVEFRVRWSNTVDGGNQLDSVGVFTFTNGPWPRTPQSICRD